MKKPKKPTLKQRIDALNISIEGLQRENQTLRGVNNENYNLKQSLKSAEAQRDSAIDNRRNAESQLLGFEAAAIAWRSAFYAVVLKKEPPVPEGVEPKYGIDARYGYGIMGR